MVKNNSSNCAVITYFLIVVLFATLRMLVNYDVFDFLYQNDVVADVVLTVIIQLGLMLSMSLFFFSLLKRQKVKNTMRQFGFRKISFKAISICLLMGVCIYFINIFVSSFFYNLISSFGYTSSSTSTTSSYNIWQLLLDLLLTAFLPAVCEETAHRGMLLSSFKDLGMKSAILLSGLMFGLMHMNIEQFFYACIIGFFFGYVACKTNSIYPTMILHLMNNSLSCIFTFASVNNIAWLDFYGFMTSLSSNNIFLYLIFFIVLIALCVYLVVLLLPHLFKATIYKSAYTLGQDIEKYKLRYNYFESLKEFKKSLGENVEEIDKFNEDTDKLFEQSLLKAKDEQVTVYPLKRTAPLEKKAKIFLYATIVLQAIITLYTFIWGVF